MDEIYIEIIGLDKFEEPEKRKIDSEITEIAKKYGNLVNATSFTVHIDKYHKDGAKSKYSLRARMSTPKKLITAKSWEWTILGAIKELKTKIHSIVESMEKSKKNFKDQNIDKI